MSNFYVHLQARAYSSHVSLTNIHQVSDNFPPGVSFSHGNMSLKIPRHCQTHFLRIPFPKSKARNHLNKSLAEFRHDQRFEAIPPYAHIRASNLVISMGYLDLRDPKHLRSACETLRAFDFSNVTGANRTPLTIGLRGITSTRPDNQKKITYTFCASVIGARWLDWLGNALIAAFKRQEIPFNPAGDPSSTSRFPYKVHLMNLGFFKTAIPDFRHIFIDPGKMRTPGIFEGRDIYAKYAGKDWVRDLPLDRICLSPKGLKDMYKGNKYIGSGHENTLTMSLSGMTLDPEDTAIVYEKSKTRVNARRVTLPLIIPPDWSDRDEHSEN